jgi:hypothetical protein
MDRISGALCASLTLGLLCMAPSAHAFATFRCNGVDLKWPVGTATPYYATNADFDRGPEESATRLPNTYKSVLEWVLAEFRRAPQNSDAFLRYDTPITKEYGNKRNEVFFTSDPKQTCERAGCMFPDWDCSTGTLIEADIRFIKRAADLPNTPGWTTSTLKAKNFVYVPGKHLDFRAVALHEFGHGFGLEHTATTFGIMGDAYKHSHTNGDTSVPFIGADDAAGLVHLYNFRSGAKPEISVSHWRYTGVNPDDTRYGLHRFESIYDSAGGKTIPVSNPPNSNERLYTVRRGQVVRPEFKLESTGRNTSTGFEVRYYLSTNDSIGVTDQLLATFPGQTLGKFGDPNYQQSVRIPTNAPTGQIMYLGIIVDALNQIAEENDDSFGNTDPPTFTGNATYIPITIIP